jgi:hypothetical protein
MELSVELLQMIYSCLTPNINATTEAHGQTFHFELRHDGERYCPVSCKQIGSYITRWSSWCIALLYSNQNPQQHFTSLQSRFRIDFKSTVRFPIYHELISHYSSWRSLNRWPQQKRRFLHESRAISRPDKIRGTTCLLIRSWKPTRPWGLNYTYTYVLQINDKCHRLEAGNTWGSGIQSGPATKDASITAVWGAC